MMAYLYEWTKNLAYYMLLLTMIGQILPNQGYQKYVRFFMGLLLIALLTGPIFRVFNMKDTFWDFYNGIEFEQNRKEMEDATRYLEDISPEKLWEE